METAAVLWTEIVARSEIRARLPAGREFHRAFDHVNHILDDAWAAAGAHTSDLRWNRELDAPGGRTGGPSVDISITSLSAGATAAVRGLDAFARAGASSTLANAVAKRDAW